MNKTLQFIKNNVLVISGWFFVGVVFISFVLFVGFLIQFIRETQKKDFTDINPPARFNIADYEAMKPFLIEKGILEQKEPSSGATVPETPATTTEETQVPVSSEMQKTEPVPDKSLLKIAVLNGTKIPKLASALRDFLEKEGFSVGRVGNNPEPNNGKTLIEMKQSKNNFLGLLQASVQKKYPLTQTAALEESAEEDAIVVIGKEQ